MYNGFPRVKHESQGPPSVMYGAKCPITGIFLGMTWAKLTSEIAWGFAQIGGYCDGICPWVDYDLDKPIWQPMGRLVKLQLHKDGYTVHWDSPQGRRTYQYRLMVLDEKIGTWGKEPVDGKPGKAFTLGDTTC